MSISRRNMLLGSASVAATAAFSALAGCGTEEGTVVLNPNTGPQTILPPVPPNTVPGPVPPAFVQPILRRETNAVLDTQLRCALGTFQVNGAPFQGRCYENALVGPTLRLRQGDILRVNVINAMPVNPDQATPPPDMNTPHHFNTTNLHTHGLHVSPSGNSDNVFVQILPNNSFQYEYQIPKNHPPGTYWYHPHKHSASAFQMMSGMAGALIIEGAIDQVPEIAAARDLVYLIQELNIQPGNPGTVPPFVKGGSFPSAQRVLPVNGEVLPKLTAFSGEVIRLRVINGTVRTTVPFSVDGHQLHLISLDGITLPAARQQASTVLGVGNRADVLIRAGAPGVYQIRKLIDNGDANPDAEIILGTMEVLPTTVTMGLPTTLPVPETLPDILLSEVTNFRTLTFAVNPGGPAFPPSTVPAGNFPNFTIDGNRFDPNRIDHSVPLNAVEQWTLLNTSNTQHPFHIHVNDFQVISINDVPLPRPEWHDTILIPKGSVANPGKVVIRQRFTDFKGLFVFHCHILVHEDLGMMQTVNVI